LNNFSTILATKKSLVLPHCPRRQRLCSFGRSHLEQSARSFETVFLLRSGICTETKNFLRQRDDVAYLRTLYKCTHYYYYH